MSEGQPKDALEWELSAFRVALLDVQNERELYELRVRFLGKKGSVTILRGRMGEIPPAERKAFGQAFNRAKSEIENSLDERGRTLAAQARDEDLRRTVDLTALCDAPQVGSVHPITRTRWELEAIFTRLGFDVADGPHVEHEKFNFDDLNIVAGHPARDMQDTFVVQRESATNTNAEGRGFVLRSHTSPVQIRSMLNRTPPLRIVMPGTVFRRDDDATHSPMFHQIEGLYVDRNVTMADLKATLYDFVGALYGPGLAVRLRPSYFPFVEPGAEFDMQCPFCRGADGASRGCSTCKRTGWIELGGCGMVHPAVFEAVQLDPEVYTGWAFGFGIDRMAMLKYDVPDLRLFFEGDLRFLEQFPC